MPSLQLLIAKLRVSQITLIANLQRLRDYVTRREMLKNVRRIRTPVWSVAAMPQTSFYGASRRIHDGTMPNTGYMHYAASINSRSVCPMTNDVFVHTAPLLLLLLLEANSNT